MRLSVLRGRPSEALRQYERCREVLAEARFALLGELQEVLDVLGELDAATADADHAVALAADLDDPALTSSCTAPASSGVSGSACVAGSDDAWSVVPRGPATPSADPGTG